MKLRPANLLPLLLIPVLGYGALKGFAYFKAKKAVDDVVRAASEHTEILYTDISTDLRGAVTVSGIAMHPHGSEDSVRIDAVRVASDDPLFFLHGTGWRPGESAPPPSMSFAVTGLSVPLGADFIPSVATPQGALPCDDDIGMNPQLLQKIGFGSIDIDLDGQYHIVPDARALELGMNIDVHNIETMQLEATLNDVDPEYFGRDGGPPPSIGRFSVALNVSPEFGRQLLKACAVGTDMTTQAWSQRLAERAIHDFQMGGMQLGPGLRNAVQRFYQNWGEFRLVGAPSQPVGALSLVFLPPEQLANALGLQLTVSGELVTDLSFHWEQPDGAALAGLLGSESPAAQATAEKRPKRVIVRREYEPVPPADIAQYVDREVMIQPRGQPMREGVLKRISNGSAEVEQSLHGGKFTVYVPLSDIQSMQALVRREIPAPQ